MGNFYRFRSIDALLGDRAELKKQTIYFAAPDELNDPMEGLAEFYWKGDRIVWKNLIRHYFTCFIYAFAQFQLTAETRPIKWDDLPWYDQVNLPAIPLTTIAKDLTEKFLARNEIARFTEELEGRIDGLSEDELHAYLRCIHPVALSVVLDVFASNGLITATTQAPNADYLGPLMEGVRAFFSDNEGQPARFRQDAIQVLFKASNHVSDQLDLINKLSNPLDDRPNFCFIYMDFSRRYLNQLRKLVYPDWYTACFVEGFQNASMWGHYATGHTGVCLQFRSKEVNGYNAISLKAPIGQNAQGPQWMKQNFQFKQVSYVSDIQKVNFFTALGRLPQHLVRDFWYADADGNKSNLMESVFVDENKWREMYWSAFDGMITRKLPDWSYEGEQRLIFWSGINDISPPSMRLLTYDFNDLEGIIFGIRTSWSDKRSIIRIVRDKCAETGRSDFRFFQAHQESKPDRVEAQPLDLIKFRSV